MVCLVWFCLFVGALFLFVFAFLLVCAFVCFVCV